MKLVCIVMSFFLTCLLNAQDIQVITHGMTKYEPVGTLEIVFDFEVVNVSSDSQIVFEVRTINDVPPGWFSSLCFGQLCFPPDIDSIATAPPILEPPLDPGDTLITSLHVFTDQITIATAYVQIQVGTFNSAEDRITLNFKATTDPTVNVNDENILHSYFLFQNYPNPFNPSTVIEYKIPNTTMVSIKVYDIIEREVAVLVNESRQSGIYRVVFNGENIASGIYFYKVVAVDFSSVKKMTL